VSWRVESASVDPDSGPTPVPATGHADIIAVQPATLEDTGEVIRLARARTPRCGSACSAQPRVGLVIREDVGADAAPNRP